MRGADMSRWISKAEAGRRIDIICEKSFSPVRIMLVTPALPVPAPVINQPAAIRIFILAE